MSKAAIISRKAFVDQLVDRLSCTSYAVEPLVHNGYIDFAEEIVIWSKLYSSLKNAYFERDPFSSIRLEHFYPGGNSSDFSHIEIMREVIAAIERRKSEKTCSCRHVLAPREDPYRRAYFHQQTPF